MQFCELVDITGIIEWKDDIKKWRYNWDVETNLKNIYRFDRRHTKII
jgi:hypothetical protein